MAGNGKTGCILCVGDAGETVEVMDSWVEVQDDSSYIRVYVNGSGEIQLVDLGRGRALAASFDPRKLFAVLLARYSGEVFGSGGELRGEIVYALRAVKDALGSALDELSRRVRELREKIRGYEGLRRKYGSAERAWQLCSEALGRDCRKIVILREPPEAREHFWAAKSLEELEQLEKTLQSVEEQRERLLIAYNAVAAAIHALAYSVDTNEIRKAVMVTIAEAEPKEEPPTLDKYLAPKAPSKAGEASDSGDGGQSPDQVLIEKLEAEG